ASEGHSLAPSVIGVSIRVKKGRLPIEARNRRNLARRRDDFSALTPIFCVANSGKFSKIRLPGVPMATQRQASTGTTARLQLIVKVPQIIPGGMLAPGLRGPNRA